MQKNQVLTLTVDSVSDQGYGVARIADTGTADDGKVVFIPGGVTKDVLNVKIIKVNSGFCVGRIEETLTPSPLRDESRACSAAAVCGGCVYRGIRYEHELELKKQDVEHAFRRAGLDGVEVEDVVHVGSPIACRNKAQYPVARIGGRVDYGFYARKTHSVVRIPDCKLEPEIFGEIARAVCAFADSHGIEPYDEQTGKGLLRHICLRLGAATGEVLLTLVLNGTKIPASQELVGLLASRFPSLVGITLNVNRRNTNVVLGDETTLLWGRDYLVDKLCGLQFRIGSGTFYQVNREGAEKLYAIAAERACLSGKETLLDLYCGIGTIGLSMVSKVKKLVGIEIVEESVERARENARANGVSNASFYVGDASSAGGILARAESEIGKIEADVAVIDPPRKGTTPELIAYLAERGIERVVYISCNPETLARDCALFRAHGYAVGKATPVDMFPGTGHVETVVALTRK